MEIIGQLPRVTLCQITVEIWFSIILIRSHEKMSACELNVVDEEEISTVTRDQFSL